MSILALSFIIWLKGQQRLRLCSYWQQHSVKITQHPHSFECDHYVGSVPLLMERAMAEKAGSSGEKSERESAFAATLHYPARRCVDQICTRVHSWWIIFPLFALWLMQQKKKRMTNYTLLISPNTEVMWWYYSCANQHLWDLGWWQRTSRAKKGCQPQNICWSKWAADVHLCL